MVRALLLTLLCLLVPVMAAPRERTPWFWRANGRIINGTVASISDFPWMLALEYMGAQSCGASIISPSWALTAAHCAMYSDTEGLALRAGTSIRESGGTVLPVSSALTNDNFHSYTLDYDVAVLQVSGTFPLDTNVQIVNLPTDNYDPPVGLAVTATGWGQTETESSSIDLLKVDLNIIDRPTCQAILPDAAPTFTERMICAGRVNKGVCYGDSGSPLVSGTLQVGIVSWGDPYCVSRGAAYSNVGSLRSWIRNNTGV